MSTDKKQVPFRYGLTVTSLDGMKIPVGTTGQRIGGNNAGYLRLNTTVDKMEFNNGARWIHVQEDLQFQGIQSANIIAVVGNVYPMDTSGAARIVTLPTNPQAGDRVALYDSNANWHTNACTVTPAAGDRIHGVTSAEAFNIRRDYVTLIYSGVASLGWVRESGGFPTASIDGKLALKADSTYVDSYHQRATVGNVSGGTNATVNVVTFPAATIAGKILVTVSKSNGLLEMFDIQFTKDSSNNVAVTIANEVHNGSASNVSVDMDYSGGVRLRLACTLASTYRTKVLWDVR